MTNYTLGASTDRPKERLAGSLPGRRYSGASRNENPANRHSALYYWNAVRSELILPLRDIARGCAHIVVFAWHQYFWRRIQSGAQSGSLRPRLHLSFVAGARLLCTQRIYSRALALPLGAAAAFAIWEPRSDRTCSDNK